MSQESKHRKFAKQFRESALRRLALAQLCRELGISRQLPYLWRDSQQREQQKDSRSAEYRLRRERIEAGRPEQNGRHERMHRTLKQDCARGENRWAQQRELDRFRQEFNQVRPHEALGMETPASLYASSPRQLSAACARAGVSACDARTDHQEPWALPLEEARCVPERGAVGRAHRAGGDR